MADSAASDCHLDGGRTHCVFLRNLPAHRREVPIDVKTSRATLQQHTVSSITNAPVLLVAGSASRRLVFTAQCVRLHSAMGALLANC